MIKNLLKRLFLVYGGFLLLAYTFYRISFINFTPTVVFFSILLFVAELHTIMLLFGMLYSLWPRKHVVYTKDNTNKKLQVNIFITIAGEPLEIVTETIAHAKKATDYYYRTLHPNKKPRVIVLNDGKNIKDSNWQEVAKFCKKLDVYHIARNTNEGFKAGNINNGLNHFRKDDPNNTIDCFLDADFCAKEYFVTELIKPLADTNVDFVQSPQRYRNNNTWVAQAAGAHQIFFFDYICPAKSYDNALFLCGTNYAIKRKALLDVGGIDNRFVTEDYATSIKLHTQGKRGILLPKVLALGLAPMNLKEYFNQQTRWCKGCLDANAKYFKPLFFGKLTFKQKLHYFLSTAYYFIGIRDLILVFAPIPYLFFGVTLIKANTMQYLAFIYLPYITYNFALLFLTFQSPIKSLVLDVIAFPVFAKAFISSVIKYNLPFTITIKKYEKENPFVVYRMQLAVALLLFVGIMYSLVTKTHLNSFGRFINYFWATYDTFFLLLGFFFVVRENYTFNWMEKIVSVVSSIRIPKFVSSSALYPQPAYAYTAVMIACMLFLSFQFNIVAFAEIPDMIVPQQKQELLVSTGGIYYGYYLPALNQHGANPTTNLLPNEHASLAMFYDNWASQNTFDGQFLHRISDQNIIPVITWEPWDSTKPNTEEDQAAFAPKNIVAGKFDDYIRSYAQGAASYKKPLFIRFAHEMNGNWYPWGDTNGNTPEDYIAMWRHVHDIFEQEHANNVIWVWSPNNTDINGKSDSIMDYYPGNEYVDWVGFSGFNWGTASNKTHWMSFKELSFDTYTILEKLNKPIMVTETSSVGKGGDKDAWLTQTFTKDIPSYPKIKAVVLFNQDISNNTGVKADFSVNADTDKNALVNSVENNGYYLSYPLLVNR